MMMQTCLCLCQSNLWHPSLQYGSPHLWHIKLDGFPQTTHDISSIFRNFQSQVFWKSEKESKRTLQELMNERLTEKEASENGGITELFPRNV